MHELVEMILQSCEANGSSQRGLAGCVGEGLGYILHIRVS